MLIVHCIMLYWFLEVMTSANKFVYSYIYFHVYIDEKK